MGKPKVSTIGGGAAKPVANAFNNWLLGGLQSGTFGGAPQQNSTPFGSGGTAQHGPFWGNIQNGLNQQFGGSGNSGMSTQPGSVQNTVGQAQGFSGAVNQLLQGNPNNYTQNNPWFTNAAQGNGGAEFGQATNQYTNPQFQNTQLQQLNTQAPAWQAAQFQNINTAMPTGVGGASGLVNPMQSISQYLNNSANGLSLGNPAAGMGRTNTGTGLDFTYRADPRMATDVDSPFAQATRNVINRQQMKDVADLRARFGQGGGMSQGTAAAYAEGNLRAEAYDKIAQAMGNINLQEQGLDLSNRSLWQQGRLQSLGLASQDQLARLGIQSGERGQDVNAAIAAQRNTNDALLQSSGQAGQLALGAANAQNQAMLQNQGLINDSALSHQANANQALNAWNANQANYNTAMNQYGLNAAEFGNNALFNMNNQNLAQNSQLNNFNLNNAQNQAQFGQQAQQFNINSALQNQQLMNNWAMGQAGIGTNLAQLAQSGQLGMLSQLMGAFGQSNQLGTAQAENLVRPNGWQQFGQIAAPIAGAALSAMTGGVGGALMGGALGGLGGGLSNIAGGMPSGLNWQGSGLNFGGNPMVSAGPGAQAFAGSPFAMPNYQPSGNLFNYQPLNFPSR